MPEELLNAAEQILAQMGQSTLHPEKRALIDELSYLYAQRYTAVQIMTELLERVRAVAEVRAGDQSEIARLTTENAELKQQKVTVEVADEVSARRKGA